MDTLVPIFTTVVMPVSIVLIVYVARIIISRHKTDVLLKAIETNPGIDAERLAESLKKPGRTPRQILNLRLLRGCIFTLSGIGLTIAGIISFFGDGWMGHNPLNPPLFAGMICLAVGISYLIVFRITRKEDSEDSKESSADQ